MEWLMASIDDEFGDVQKYLYKAEAIKDSNPNIAENLYNIAKQELNHANILHQQILTLLNKGEENFEDWKYRNEAYIKKLNQLKLLISEY